MKTTSDIKYLFEPRSIAVIGASHKKGKVGYTIMDNIISGGYKGKVYPINPAGGEILGCKVYEDISDVPGEIDIAVIVVPAKYVFDTVKASTEKGVKFAPIISSGFSEVGEIELEKKVVEYGREHALRVLGPNIFGIYSAECSLNATFGPGDIRKGGVAIITQSGALGIAMVGKTKDEGIGLSAVISVGNKSDIDEADLLEYLVASDRTKVIMMYMEGVKDGERLVRVLKDATRKKPIVVIKSGRSKRGALAAASHTGSLAGADEVFSDIMKQCGVNRAENLEEALNWCKFLSSAPMPKGENTIIITNGGGIGVLMADACEKYGVKFYDDLDVMKKTFEGVVPSFGSVKNPIDLTGQATSDDYGKAMKAAMANADISSVVCLICEAGAFDTGEWLKIARNFYDKSRSVKPLIFSFVGGEKTTALIEQLKKFDIPVFSEVYEAASCLGALYMNYNNLRRARDSEDLSLRGALRLRGSTTLTALSSSKGSEQAEATWRSSVDPHVINDVVAKVISSGRKFLLSQEARVLMNAAGIKIPKSIIARNIKDAVEAAHDIGYPVVLKVVSKDIIHKSDAGGIALHLDNDKEVVDAYQAIIHNCRAHDPNAKIDGVEVAEMVKPGTETIVGARMDKSFGPVIMFGMGGIYVEVMKDVAFRALPVDTAEALSMIKDTRIYPLLLGVRGEEKKDIGKIVEAIFALGDIIEKCEGISDIEINPLVVYDEGDGVNAIDIRVMLK